jgi:hypothetical protein
MLGLDAGAFASVATTAAAENGAIPSRPGIDFDAAFTGGDDRLCVIRR